MAGATPACIFCRIAAKSTPTTFLYSDDMVVAFQDISPSAFRHYLVIPVEHIPTVNELQKRDEDYSLVVPWLTNGYLSVFSSKSHVGCGETLLHQDAPQSTEYRFGFHPPPFNSVDHLHLHCLALPFIPKWKYLKYTSLGSLGFVEAEELLAKIKPSKVFTL
ncbi:histidine triad family protein [Salix suchowensis]|nr:histidine triad family protein [Salix suchowensis]